MERSGTEPMCKDGTCHQAHSVILKNMDVDNFPQVRIFVDTRLKHYPQIVLLPSQLKLPTFTFKDAAGKEVCLPLIAPAVAKPLSHRPMLGTLSSTLTHTGIFP